MKTCNLINNTVLFYHPVRSWCFQQKYSIICSSIFFCRYNLDAGDPPTGAQWWGSDSYPNHSQLGQGALAGREEIGIDCGSVGISTGAGHTFSLPPHAPIFPHLQSQGEGEEAIPSLDLIPYLILNALYAHCVICILSLPRVCHR